MIDFAKFSRLKLDFEQDSAALRGVEALRLESRDDVLIAFLRDLWSRFVRPIPSRMEGVTHIIDLDSGQLTNTIPRIMPWGIFRPTTGQVWFCDFDSNTNKACLDFEVWPTHAPRPPWWLWLATATCAVLVIRIWWPRTVPANAAA